jgi:hypothetical protein
MSPERRQRILEVADELEAAGQAATNSAVYARVMGHRGHVVQTLKARRAERAATGMVTVAEEEDDDPEDETTETPAAVLAEDLTQLEHSYESWHLALERLWQIEQDGPLSEANFSRKSWLEYQMVQNLQTQERLRGALETARTREGVYAAQQQHDARLEEARALAEQALQAVATMHDLFEDLAEVFGAQVDAFFPFRDGRGHQAFDVADGPLYALQLFQQFFGGDPRARDAFDLIVRSHLTVGMMRQALAACPRLIPFSENAIRGYLNSIPATEGSTNGSQP